MPTVTNLWPDKHGKPHYPVELMDNVHIRSAHRLCCYRLYIRDSGESDPESLAKAYGIFITRNQAEKWIPIFKAEAKKRKMILHKPDQLNYQAWLETRQTKKFFNQQNFNKITSYDHNTNDYGGKHI